MWAYMGVNEGCERGVWGMPLRWLEGPPEGAGGMVFTV